MRTHDGTIYTIIELSSEGCSDHNLKNKREIDAGLSFPVRPTQQILNREALARSCEVGAKAIFDRAGIGTNTVTKSGYRNSFWAAITPDEIRLTLDCHDAYSFSSGHWRATVSLDGYAQRQNSRWLRIGDGLDLTKVTEKQWTKLAKAIEEIRAVAQTKAEARKLARHNQTLLAEVKLSNPDVVALWGANKVPHRDLTRLELIWCNGESFTLAQWQAIAEQDAAHKKQLAHLKQIFTNDNSPSAEKQLIGLIEKQVREEFQRTPLDVSKLLPNHPSQSNEQ